MTHGFIPHQLHMTKEQAMKMVHGLPVMLKHHQMGSGMGHHVIMLKPQNARKLLTAYKKGKGMKMHLHPDELHHSIHHGRGLYDYAKKIYHGVGNTVNRALQNPMINEMAGDAVHYGSDALGTAVGTFMGNPVAGLAVGELLGRAGEHAIKSRLVDTGTRDDKVYGDMRSQAKEIAFDAMHNKIHDLPKEYQGIASKALQGAFDKSTIKKDMYESHPPSRKMPKSFESSGGKLKKGSAEAKAFMASIRKKKSGGAIDMDPLHLGDKIRDAGNKIKDTFSDVGNKIVQGVNDVGHAIVSGVDHAGNDIKGAVSPVISKVSDITHYPALIQAVKSNPSLLKDMMYDLKTVGHYVIPATLGAIGGFAGSTLGGPLGGVAGSALGSYAGTQADKALGIEGNTTLAGMGIRTRGRPRKIKGGDLASVSKPFRKALKNNFNGLILSNIVNDNQPVSRFRVNPRVRPSSTEMTLSPYQSMSSPAMNPFIPTSYTQEGGTSQGYGGRGIQHHDMGMSKMDVIHFGHPENILKNHRRRKTGVGLYGP
jgi:hypothetical protein